MGGKKIRSRKSNDSIPVTSLSNRSVNLNSSNSSNVNRNKLPEDLLSLTKEQLKLECRKRGQKTTGTKTELLQRLGHKMLLNRRKESATSNGSIPSQNNTVKTPSQMVSKQAKQQEKLERESIVLWRRPILTLQYFCKEVFILLETYGRKLLQYRRAVILTLISILSLLVISKLGGPHQKFVQGIYKKLLWCLYWTGLGILSSVGLGTGLHTFLLYLGPHIAQVTLAAYECGSLNFPEPPYPDEIICPSIVSKSSTISILTIMSKVRLEAMCWGAGTALGELPPYFMARAARLSGIDPDEDDELKEFEELQHKSREDLTLIERGKVFVEDIVQRVGFLGILACASIPNPLFDLAGITCGHFLVPFWTFFGATLIGKAIIKMHIQKLFVIIAFNETLIITALSWLKVIPFIGNKLQEPFKAFLDGQKLKLHRKGGASVPEKGNILASVFEKFVFAMILYFVISIINSFAQSYHKRINKRKMNKSFKD